MRREQKDFAQWLGVDHALAYPNGTMAILGAGCLILVLPSESIAQLTLPGTSIRAERRPSQRRSTRPVSGEGMRSSARP